MAYIDEGVIYGTTSNQYIECRAYWGITQNKTENYSEVMVSVYYQRTNTGYSTEGTWRGSITVNGTTYNTSVKVSITSNPTYITYTTIKVPHNADGTKTCAISVSGSISGTTLTATYLSGSITLPEIARQANLTSAPDFNDEENPTIYYNNKAGTQVSSLQACISFDGSTPDIAYRDVSKTGSSYTFNLTANERKILRAGTTGKSRTVKFYLKTVLNGTTYYSSLSKTYSIVNANPTISPTIVDVDTQTLALTGNNNRIIKYYSDARFTTGAAAIKEAKLVSQKITCGGKSSTAASGTLTNVESGNFIITATDSRGFTTTQTVKKTIVEYVKLTCNVEASTPTAAGNMTLTIKGNYFNGGFGAKNNTLTVNYRMRVEEEEWGSWTAATATLSGNTYYISIPISGLDYQTKYSFQARAADLLMTVESAGKSVKSLPVFDWSKDDFRFNVPVRLNAGGDLPHKLLWQGQNYMNASQTAYLTEPVSKQFSGIVLVFSNYDTSSGTGVANNYDWHCFYIPKRLVELQGGTGHTFNMMSQAFGDIASKYLYISDTSIAGNDVNTTNGTRNGITYNNAKYVMRYVLGV